MRMLQECYGPLSLLKATFAPGSLDAACIAALRSKSVPTHSSFAGYLFYFALTCALEAPFYSALGRAKGLKPRTWLGQILVLNLATHPLVFWGFPWFFSLKNQSMFRTVLAAELLAPLVEAALLRFAFKSSWTISIAVAFLANLFSWSIALSINPLH
jgi:hypothetical protein